MRKLYSITNLSDVRIRIGPVENVWMFAIDQGDRLDIVSDVVPVAECDSSARLMFTERLAEDWEQGWKITRAKECKRV